MRYLALFILEELYFCIDNLQKELRVRLRKQIGLISRF